VLIAVGALFLAPVQGPVVAEQLSDAPGHRLVAGPDGALWFTTADASARPMSVVRMATDGTVQEYPVPDAAGLHDITVGPDGALWFIARTGPSSVITRMTIDGDIIARYPGRARVGMARIAGGPDGAMWFTTAGTVGPASIGRLTVDGEVTYPFQRYCALGPPLRCAEPRDIALLPSGPRWIRGFGGITAGPDGAMWFTELEPNRIGRIMLDGVATEYEIPTPRSEPSSIVSGPDGALWFVETNANQIGRSPSMARLASIRFRLRIVGR
jgi:virginiamycin B lyase